jgi:HAD superfamily hydrolase (TIGR01549 family)
VGAIRAAFFDVGETLVDESRVWERWADRAGVHRSTLFAALGAAIERREHHRAVFSLFGVDSEQLVEHDDVDRYELYPDALRCLERLRAAGIRLGAVGNQPQAAERWLHEHLGDDVLVASSASWGTEKPQPPFFARIVELAGVAPEHIVYVGDRVDNDVLPAAAAGMRTVLVRRGPWGMIQAGWPEAVRADVRAGDLDEAAAAILAL